MSALSEFFKTLNEEERNLLPHLANDNFGMLLRSAANELDYSYYCQSKSHKMTYEQEEIIYIMQLGVSRLLKLALEVRDSFDVSSVMFCRNKEFSLKTLELVSAFGFIQHGRRVAQTVLAGVGNIEKTGPKDFVITLPQEVEDEDFYEREVVRHYNDISSKMFEEVIASDEWRNFMGEIDSALNKLVYPYMGNFIGYDADPMLDDFFYGLAFKQISSEEGYDTYHYAIEFGGIRVQHYMLALQFVVADRLRHEKFAEALIQKNPEIKIENILTISAEVGKFLESLRDAVNYFGSYYDDFYKIDLAQAEQIFDVLTYSRKKLDLLDPPGSPYPLAIRCTSTGMIKSLYGARSEPVRFLLESLRYNFPKEYDKNQASREGSFQRACIRVLNDTFPNLEYRENIKISLDGKILSDIDLVVLEKSTSTVFLCQLKHQELYGSDIYAKSSRGERLKSQAKSWLEILDNWIDSTGFVGMKSALKLPKDWSKELDVYRLILSRHYAFPLKKIISGKRYAFGTWPQFFNCNLVVKEKYLEPELKQLIKSLQENQEKPEKVTHLKEPTTRWHVGNTTFLTQQAEETDE